MGRFTDHLPRNPGLSARPVIQRELDAPRVAYLQPSAGQGDFIPHLVATFRSLERGFHQPVVAADFPMACTRSTPVLFPAFDLPQGWRLYPLCYDNARRLTVCCGPGFGLDSIYHVFGFEWNKKWTWRSFSQMGLCLYAN